MDGVTPNSPRIDFVSEKKMVEMVFGPDASATHVRAFYKRDEETIYLRDDWNPVDLRNQAELLHELVHHVQKFNKVEAPCPAALERQAYDLHLEWLRERGVEDPYAFMGINELFVLLVSTCRKNE